MLFLEYKKRIFDSSAKLIASDLEVDEPFISMHHSIMTKMKNSAGEDWVAKTVVEHSIKIFEYCIDVNNAMMHGVNKLFISLLYKLNLYFERIYIIYSESKKGENFLN